MRRDASQLLNAAAHLLRVSASHFPLIAVSWSGEDQKLPLPRDLEKWRSGNLSKVPRNLPELRLNDVT